MNQTIAPNTLNPTSTQKMETLQSYHISNEAMSMYASTNHLFYLPGRKIEFRCCVTQDIKSIKTDNDYNKYIYRIKAATQDIFSPEKTMGSFIGQDSYEPSYTKTSIQEFQIPSSLAEKIQSAVPKEFKPNSKAFEALKKEVGNEFEKFAQTLNITLLF